MLSTCRHKFAAVLLAAGLVAPLAAEADEGRHRFADDLYAVGVDVLIAETGIDDVFAAGETVSIDAFVRKSAYAAGRRVVVGRPVGENLYAAGYGIEVASEVGGDAIAAGYRVRIVGTGSVGGDALLAGRFVHVRGPIAGNANLVGEEVEIAAPIAGSVEVRASRIRFAEGARIGGTLSYWIRDPVAVPGTVVAVDRVNGRTMDGPPRPSWGLAFAVGLVLVLFGMAVFAALFAWLFPAFLARARARLILRPWWSLALGLAALSALVGAVPVLGASIVGLPLVPLILLVAPFVLFAAYLTSAHAVGKTVFGLVRRDAGAGRGAAFAAIVVGAVVFWLLALIPIFGWVLTVLAVVAGLGSWLALYLSRPHRVRAGEGG